MELEEPVDPEALEAMEVLDARGSENGEGSFLH